MLLMIDLNTKANIDFRGQIQIFYHFGDFFEERESYFAKCFLKVGLLDFDFYTPDYISFYGSFDEYVGHHWGRTSRWRIIIIYRFEEKLADNGISVGRWGYFG